MAHVVSGKLRKAPFIKEGCGPQQDSTMFAIELSEMIKAYNSDEKFYTNYSALFFAKTPNAKEFYHKAFAEGSFVSVACEKLKTDIQHGQDGRTFVKMQMENPRLEGVMSFGDMVDDVSKVAQQYQNQNQQQMQHQYQPQGQPQYNAQPADFDDD